MRNHISAFCTQLSLVIALVACSGGDSTTAPQSPGTQQPPPPPPPDTAKPPAGYLGFRVGAVLRIYKLHAPEPTPAGKLPVVIWLHSLGSGANPFLDSLANAQGFVAVYPEATKHGSAGVTPTTVWNAGGVWEEASEYTNDVAFITALLDTVAAHHTIDGRRVYVAGMSNGAQMAYRLAHEKAARIAGIMAISGQEFNISYATPTQDPVAILHMHGLTDASLPYDGQASINLSSVSATLQRWCSRQQCAPRADTVLKSDSVLGVRWRTPTGRGDVVLYTHPGGHFPPPIDFPAIMWDFFKSLPLRPE